MSLSKNSNNTGTLHALCGRGAVNEISKFLKDSLSFANQLEERVGFLGYTPLHEATHRGHVPIVRLLLLYGANPNATANGFYTCLHMAASMDNEDCVKELLKYKADITCRDEFGKTPYETAVIHKCKNTARILKSAEILKLAQENSPQLTEILRSLKKDSISPTCLQEALERASEKGHVDAMQSIILAGIKESLKFDDCIVMSLQFNFIKALSVLLVCYAAQNGHVEMLQYLLDGHQKQEQKDIALKQLPFSKNCHSHIVNIRTCLKDKELLRVAVPLQLSLHNKHKEATKALLLGTNCDQERREIEWKKLALCELDPSIFRRIRWVERLQLSHNMLTSVPRDVVDLHKLCRLNLENNQLERIPSGLLKMNCLRILNLSKNKLTELPKKSHWSPSLTTLYVNDNQLEDLPRNITGSKLKNLYIARNMLYEVPPHVCEVLTLETLDLSGNSRLTQLPVQMGKLTNISTLNLDNLDQVTDPPENIKKSGAKTIMYLRAKLRNAKGYYSMKLMLVGRAAQGKTTLMHRLMYDYTYNLNSATNGISMEEFRIRKDVFHKEYLFRMWDFGGQEDYYATHQCFLSTLSLYILVWNLEEGEEGVAKLEGWLDTISSRAPGTCLIIVGTHVDKIRKDKDKYDENYLTRMHDYAEKLKSQDKYQRIFVIGIKEVSCAIDSREGIDELRITIYDAASAMLKVNGTSEVSVMGELIPHSYLLIEELMKTIRDNYKKANELPFIRRAEYEALVTDTIKHDGSDVEDPNDVRDVTKFLHERGIVMHYDDPNQDLQDYYFIDPSWLCDLMARIVTLKEANPYGINGILFKDKFEFIFKDERFPLKYYAQFVRLLNRFQIACSLDENRLLVPSKLPEEKPSEATNLSLPFITIKRIHSLPFMPYGFWDRFMARLLYYTEDMLSSGCSNERGPNSPGGPEIDHLSPFLLDPFCCKCPLSSNSVAIGLQDSDVESKSNESSSKFSAEQGDQAVSYSPNENSPPTEEASYLNEDIDVDDEEDNEEDEFRYVNVGRYVDEDEVDVHDGVRINGQWFGQEGSSGDSDFGYSTDEDGEQALGLGLKDGLYRPRFVRGREVNYKRKPQERKRNSKSRTSSAPFSVSPESFEDHSTKENSISSSQSSSLNQQSPEILNGEKKYNSSSLSNRSGLWNETAHSRSSEGSGSSHSSSHSNLDASSNSPLKANLAFERNLSVESSESVGSHSISSEFQGKPSSSSKKVQYENQIQVINQQPLEQSVVVEETQKSSCKTEIESDMYLSCNQSTRRVSEDSCKLLPTIEQYLKINDHEKKSEDSLQPDDFLQKSVDDTSTHSSSKKESKIEVSLNSRELDTASSNESEDYVTSRDTLLERDESSNNKEKPAVKDRTPTTVVPEDVHLGRQALIQEPTHEANCRARKDFVFSNLSDIPTDLSSLIDGSSLFCWRTGICLNHERLFFSISTMKDPSEDRVLIVTEVTPSRVGRRVLNYIVDHIDTLIKEWYPDLSLSDGIGPRVRQYIPCVLCERHGIKPHRFSFVECQLQSAQADNIPCPNHSGTDLSLHLVAPDVMLQDVDPQLLLSKDEIQFDEGESSQIGSGGFGKVVRGKCRNQQVAIKFFVQNDETDPVKHYFEARKELNVLRRVRQHPYLISIIGVCLRPLCLVLELAEKGNLQDSLYSSMAINRIVLFRIAYQVADALSYLHTLNIIYRDLKPENILVWSLDERDDLHVKLIDFGTANFATSTGLISVKGTLGTKAPEMLQLSEKKEEYTMKVDVYSYAVLLFQMVVRERPFLEFDSEPMINAAVVRGERPKWSKCHLSRYGLPSLSELMLQCWLSKPTLRPNSVQIAQQVRMPTFQALLGKQYIPSQQSVRHACLVPERKELWIACDDPSSNKIFIFDCNNLDLKHTFAIESYQDHKYSLQIQALHHVAELMLIAVRGPVHFISAYSTSPRYNNVCSVPLDEQATCMTSDDSYIYVGMNEGRVRCILKKDFKKPEKKRNDHLINVERHCILSLVATEEKLWVSSSKYIFTYFTKTAEMEAFDMESLWYGGSTGMEDKHQTRITNLTIFDQQHVWSTCRSVLTKWCAAQRQIIFEIDCLPIIQSIDHSRKLHESDSCILCITPVLDTMWAGTAGGHILIFRADEPKLLTWFHPFGEVRTLSTCIGPGPCGTELCLVFSTGKSLRADGLGTRDPVVCPLTSERVRQVPDDLSTKFQAEQSRSKSRRKSSSASRNKSDSIFYVDGDAVDAARRALFKCSMLVWEAVPANVLARMEAKSGRVPVVVHRGCSPEEDH